LPASARGFERRRLAAVVLALAVAAGAGTAAAAPRRVVSLHLCTDQLLLGLADRGQIASLSHFANDPVRSPMAAAAKGLRRNYGTAEEAIDQRADLVLSVAPAARATVQTLRRLGYRVTDLKLAKDFAAIRQHIRIVAAALGHPDRGAALIAAMDRRLAAARADARGRRPVAVIWQPGGFTDGPGSLEDAVLRAAGFDNLAARLGLGALGHLPLERLVLAHPDLVVNWMGNENAPSLARDALHHPALRRAAHGTPVVTVPPALWTCGTWFTAEAVALLADARRRLVRVQQAARGGAPPPYPSPARGEGTWWRQLDSLPPPPRRGRAGVGVGPQGPAVQAGTR
jgi:iron complex transport system substrate-binding protein